MRAIFCLALMLVMGADLLEAQWRRRIREPERSGRGEAPVEFGVRGGYDFDAEVGSAGAQLRIPLVRQLLVVPSGDVFFAEEDEGTSWQLNADLVVRPDELGGFYGGAGAAFLRADFDADDEREVEAGYNLFVGLEGGRLLSTRVRPFAEARWSSVEDLEPFRLVAGINTPVR
ncbi:MAG TPA: hypothetical protein VF167_09600 [Longimicrobiaceae bacterium]